MQMNDRMQKTIDGLYEILELNVSEPIMFQGDNKNKQHMYNEKKKQVILVVPREI
jgi:hypothetical protein